jgi:DNA-binding FrmR family transcriptional regulator
MTRKDKHTRSIVNRLKRIEGQVKGLIRMSDEGRPCEDILLQIKAVQSALKKVGLILATEHIDHCIKEAIKEGKGAEAVDSLKETLAQSLDL